MSSSFKKVGACRDRGGALPLIPEQAGAAKSHVKVKWTLGPLLS
jgi:hypothetical protein